VGTFVCFKTGFKMFFVINVRRMTRMEDTTKKKRLRYEDEVNTFS
jgi:hypothetical protein